jgi:hypothetical protein
MARTREASGDGRLLAGTGFLLGVPKTDLRRQRHCVGSQLPHAASCSRCRPVAVADQRPLGVFGVTRRLSRSANGPSGDSSTYATSDWHWTRSDVPKSGLAGNSVVDENAVDR